MKLHTSIPPRRDGTVTVTGQDRQPYVFEAGEDGELSCEVTDEATLAWMLATDNFYPASPEDAERAGALVETALAQSNPDHDDGPDDGPDDGADDGADDEAVIATALPVEAKTPPSAKKPRKVK